MVADLLIANLLRIAKQDLDDALRLSSPYSRNAIYHCEQAAEKVIRAVLTSEGKHGGIGHQLADMVNLIPDVNPIKTQLRDLQALSVYATAYRYITPAGRIPNPPSPTEFAAFAQKVEAALSFAVLRFGVDLSVKDKPASTPNPIR